MPPYSSARSRTMARPRPEPGAASSARTPRCEHGVSQRRVEPGTVVVHAMTTHRAHRPREDSTVTRDRAHLQALSSRLPEHLVEVFALAAHGVLGRRPRRRCVSPRSACSRSERAGQALDRGRRPSSGRPGRRPTRRRARGRGDSPPAAACARPAGAIVAARSPWPAAAARSRLLGEHGERRLEAVREVAGLGLRARDAALAVVEQRVQVAHERLHLGRIARLRVAPVAPVAHGRRARRAAGRAATCRAGPGRGPPPAEPSGHHGDIALPWMSTQLALGNVPDDGEIATQVVTADEAEPSRARRPAGCARGATSRLRSRCDSRGRARSR